jgi:site-specific recombinase XerD
MRHRTSERPKTGDLRPLLDSQNTASANLPESSDETPPEPTIRPARRPQIVIPVHELKQLTDEFILDCQYRHLKPGSINNYQNQFEHFFWFLERQQVEACGTLELKQFFDYLQSPPGKEGRWGKKYLQGPLRPQTAKDYHISLRRLFNWMIKEEILPFSPMQRVMPPVVRTGLKQPLRPEQVEAMLRATKVSSHPSRNAAILLLLLDTGLRASELCNLRIKDMDFQNRQAQVVGKGDKRRMCYWGLVAARALSRYRRHDHRSGEEPVFVAVGGTGAGGPLTPQGLYKMIRDVGKIAGVKCGCHDFRRTFAVSILRNGANLISVQRLMGHETISITQGYLNIAQTDIEEQHRQFSPADRLKLK